MRNKNFLCKDMRSCHLFQGILIALALCLPALSFADSYLDSLEVEADNTTILEKAQEEKKKLQNFSSKEPSKSLTSKSATVKEEITGDTTDSDPTKDFEAGLYREFPGNYAVYTTLSEDEKQKVLTAYVEAKSIKGLMRFGPSLTLILELALESKTSSN